MAVRNGLSVQKRHEHCHLEHYHICRGKEREEERFLTAMADPGSCQSISAFPPRKGIKVMLQ